MRVFILRDARKSALLRMRFVANWPRREGPSSIGQTGRYMIRIMETRVRSFSISIQGQSGRKAERLAQARGILAGHGEIVIPLEPFDRLAGLFVERAGHLDWPVAEFIEHALQRAQLARRIDEVGDRIGAR